MCWLRGSVSRRRFFKSWQAFAAPMCRGACCCCTLSVRTFSPFNTISPQFRERLRATSPHPIDLYEASVQIERLATPEGGPLIDYLNALFLKRDLDLIVTMGGPATRFVRNRAELFPSAPLLIAASEVRTFSEFALGANATACPTSSIRRPRSSTSCGFFPTPPISWWRRALRRRSNSGPTCCGVCSSASLRV